MESFVPYALEIVLGLVSLVLLYRYANSPFSYWKKRGVPQVKVNYPFIGNSLDNVFKSLPMLTTEYYWAFPNDRFVGTYQLRTPQLLIRDPELVEAILIKDFSYMPDRGNREDPNSSGLAKHLLNLNGDHWKNLRNKLTPTFSSGKLKGMHGQLIDCAQSLMTFMKTLEDGRPFEARDVISRFTMDVIASCAFGLNLDTINDPECEFRKIGLIVFKPSSMGKFIFLLGSFMKPIMRKLAAFRSPFDIQKFFTNAVDNTIEYRKNNNVVRQDFLHLMNELRLKDQSMIKNKEIDPTNPHIFDHATMVSNAFVFFLAGFETTATTVSYAMYELAINQDVQDRLYTEVSTVLRKHGGTATFEAVQEMEFLDQVISETLRKYPPAPALSRKVTKDYRLPGTDLILYKDTVVRVPTYAFHHDPEYFPEPDKFLPERFANGEDEIRKGTYLPFGGGPRICIGARFAKLEAKVCLAMMMMNFKIIKSDKTVVPLTFDSSAILLVPKGGIWVAIEPRNAQKI